MSEPITTNELTETLRDLIEEIEENDITEIRYSDDEEIKREETPGELTRFRDIVISFKKHEG